MRNKLDQLDELAMLIMLLVAIIFMGAMFGNNNEYRKDLRERVQEAREAVWEVNERSK